MHADQPVIQRAGDQTLRNLTRNAERIGDLILRLSCHVIHPRRPRRQIQFFIILTHAHRPTRRFQWPDFIVFRPAP